VFHPLHVLLLVVLAFGLCAHAITEGETSLVWCDDLFDRFLQSDVLHADVADLAFIVLLDVLLLTFNSFVVASLQSVDFS